MDIPFASLSDVQPFAPAWKAAGMYTPELRQRVASSYPYYCELPAASEDYISLNELCGASYGANVRGGGLNLTENELRNLIEHEYSPRPLFHRNGVEYWDTDELEAYLFEWFVPFTHEEIEEGRGL